MEYGVTILANPIPVTNAGSGLENLNATNVDGWRSVFQGLGGKSSAGVNVTPTTAMGYPPLWRALNVISDDVASLPCNVFVKDDSGMGRDVDEMHYGEMLLRGFSTMLHPQRVMKTITAHAMLYGNGYAAIDRDMRKRPVDWAVLDPHSMMIRVVDNRIWYVTTIDNEQVRIPSEDIVHIRGLSNDGITGLNVIHIMKDALGLGMAAQQYGGRFFGQGSNAGGLLMIPGHFSEEKVRNTINAWQSMTQGLQQAHKVALLQDGAKFQQLTVTNDQAQFLQTREFELRATIANIFGIPPHMLGDGTRTSHNSLEQEDQNYLNRALNPWLKEWERELSQKLLSSRERSQQTHFVEFNREALIQMSFQDKVQGIAKQLEVGVLNVNESRRLLNLPDIGEDGERRFRPANWVFLDAEMGAKPDQNDNNQDDPEDDPEDNPDDSGQQRNILRAMVTSSVTKQLKVEKDRIVRASKNADKFTTQYEEFYDSFTENLTANMGWNSPGVVMASQQHIEESKRQLLDLTSVTTTGNLESSIRDLVACWDARSETLIDSIVGAVK